MHIKAEDENFILILDQIFGHLISMILQKDKCVLLTYVILYNKLVDSKFLFPNKWQFWFPWTVQEVVQCTRGPRLTFWPKSSIIYFEPLFLPNRPQEKNHLGISCYSLQMTISLKYLKTLFSGLDKKKREAISEFLGHKDAVDVLRCFRPVMLD